MDELSWNVRINCFYLNHSFISTWLIFSFQLDWFFHFNLLHTLFNTSFAHQLDLFHFNQTNIIYKILFFSDSQTLMRNLCFYCVICSLYMPTLVMCSMYIYVTISVQLQTILLGFRTKIKNILVLANCKENFILLFTAEEFASKILSSV